VYGAPVGSPLIAQLSAPPRTAWANWSWSICCARCRHRPSQGWRIGLAQGLLAKGRQLKHVADEVGYGSPNALTRAFVLRTGSTPTEWLAAQRRAVPEVSAPGRRSRPKQARL